MHEHGIERYSIAIKYQLGVVIKPLQGDEDYTGMLAIPYISRGGIKALKFRRLDEGKPKCFQHEGQKLRLYNPNAYFEAGLTIGIAEGEPDAICATECLGVPTIGIPGTQAWVAHKRVWASNFKNFPRVLVFTQGDPVNEHTGLRPGEELGKAITESLGWRVKIVPSPEGEDVCSMVASGRAGELLEKIGSENEDA